VRLLPLHPSSHACLHRHYLPVVIFISETFGLHDAVYAIFASFTDISFRHYYTITLISSLYILSYRLLRAFGHCHYADIHAYDISVTRHAASFSPFFVALMALDAFTRHISMQACHYYYIT